jgi:putative addiction module killer protein
LGPCTEVRYRLIRSVRPPDTFRSAIVNAIIARALGIARASLLSENVGGLEVRHYLTKTGRDPYQTWLDRLKDLRARVAIQRRVDRIASGNFGDHKPCRDGVWELRVDVGQGYRVYYARHDRVVVVLLCAGDKRTQASDIDTAVTYWADYQQRLT